MVKRRKKGYVPLRCSHHDLKNHCRTLDINHLFEGKKNQIFKQFCTLSLKRIPLIVKTFSIYNFDYKLRFRFIQQLPPSPAHTWRYFYTNSFLLHGSFTFVSRSNYQCVDTVEWPLF